MERWVIFLILILGGLLFYTFSIFFSNPLANQQPQLISGSEQIDSEIAQLESEQFGRRGSIFASGGDMYANAFGSNKGPYVDSDAETIITNEINLSQAQNNLLYSGDFQTVNQTQLKNQKIARLKDLGIENNDFINLMLDDKSEIEPTLRAVNSLVDKNKINEARHILDETLYRTNKNSYSLLASLYKKSAEINFMLGDQNAFDENIAKLIENYEAILASYRQSKMMDYHLAREYASNIEKELNLLKSGSMNLTMHFITSGQSNGLEFATAMKTGMMIQNISNPGTYSEEEIKESSNQIEGLFTNFRH